LATVIDADVAIRLLITHRAIVTDILTSLVDGVAEAAFPILSHQALLKDDVAGELLTACALTLPAVFYAALAGLGRIAHTIAALNRAGSAVFHAALTALLFITEVITADGLRTLAVIGTGGAGLGPVTRTVSARSLSTHTAVFWAGLAGIVAVADPVTTGARWTGRAAILWAHEAIFLERTRSIAADRRATLAYVGARRAAIGARGRALAIGTRVGVVDAWGSIKGLPPSALIIRRLSALRILAPRRVCRPPAIVCGDALSGLDGNDIRARRKRSHEESKCDPGLTIHGPMIPSR